MTYRTIVYRVLLQAAKIYVNGDNGHAVQYAASQMTNEELATLSWGKPYIADPKKLQYLRPDVWADHDAIATHRVVNHKVCRLPNSKKAGRKR